MKRKILFICLSIYAFIVVSAQTVVWKVTPGKYDSFTRLFSGMLLVKEKGKIGVISYDGNIIVPTKYDTISGFYEDKAIVTEKKGAKNRIAGVLFSDGHYVSFDDTYFLIDNVNFFSEQILPVEDKQGRKGYIDTQGSQVLGFDGMYKAVTPFTEGYSAVFRNGKLGLINKDGKSKPIILGTGRTLTVISNVYNGKAYFKDNHNQYYEYDVENGTCKKTDDIDDSKGDYLGCFNSVTNRTSIVPFTTIYYKDYSYLTYTNGNDYGFKFQNSTYFPFQFSSVTFLSDDLCIVSLNKKNGILNILNSSTPFSVSTPHNKLSYKKGKSVNCEFQIKIPDVWIGKNIRVEIKNKGKVIEHFYITESKLYSLKYNPTSKSEEFNVDLSSDGLLLCNSQTIEFSFMQEIIPNPPKPNPLPNIKLL